MGRASTRPSHSLDSYELVNTLKYFGAGVAGGRNRYGATVRIATNNDANLFSSQMLDCKLASACS